MSTRLHLKYPYDWGESIVERLIQKYVRASLNSAKNLGVTPKVLRRALILTLCSGNSRVWEYIRWQISHCGGLQLDLEHDQPIFFMEILNKCAVEPEIQHDLFEKETLVYLNK